MTKPTLYYIYDPMCSWCWGYRPTWLRLQDKLENRVEIKSMVGGLAEDSNSPMPEKMQTFLQQTWHKISAELGTTFNFDFWSLCQPKRSTYPSCRAIIFARKYHKEHAMCLAIQQAYYLHAQNPSEISTLTQIAAAIGLDVDLFAQQINSNTLKQQLADEITMARNMPIQGFPSLVLAVNDELFSIPIDYKDCATSYDKVLDILTNQLKGES
ncbi:MAG: DsbA family protein [Colwellia sp.]|nr:DsbA family protein [Colwellia sp.]MCW8865819.1 DsbA family protein [Colwellia sp.]MCW9081783.1 DsbA family protein [Colwellia sp.]